MNLVKKILNSYFFWFLIVIIPLLITIQNIFVGPSNTTGPYFYTHYNNFIIFKQSFFHLINHKNLYVIYESEYEDLYKYSPTFAFFMGVFSVLPNWLGLFIWNFFGVFVLCYAIKKLVPEKSKLFYLFIFLLPELILTTQNSQSNALLTGFILLAFIALENNKKELAALFIIATIFIKLFTLVTLILFLFYPKKGKSVLYSILWGIIFLCIPLLLIGPDELYQQYLNWLEMLKNDHSISYGLSFLGFLNALNLFTINKIAVLIFGIVVLLLPLINYQNWDNIVYRRNYLFFVLIWMVVFNHKAESPSYILAITGCGLWAYFNGFTKLRGTLLVFCFIFSSLVCTDIFPLSIRNGFIKTYEVKSIMPMVILLIIGVELLFQKKAEQELINSEEVL